jgi:hypothetical protein
MRKKLARASRCQTLFIADLIPACNKGDFKMRAVAAILAASVFIAPEAAHAAPLSNDDQIREVFAGNTISGQERGETYIEYFQPDGRIAGKGREGRYSGHWGITRGQMCMRYDEVGNASSSWDCVRVRLEGNRVIWIDQGEKSYSTLTPGNPYGL